MIIWYVNGDKVYSNKNTEERFYFYVGVDSEFIPSVTKFDKKG